MHNFSFLLSFPLYLFIFYRLTLTPILTLTLTMTRFYFLPLSAQLVLFPRPHHYPSPIIPQNSRSPITSLLPHPSTIPLHFHPIPFSSSFSPSLFQISPHNFSRLFPKQFFPSPPIGPSTFSIFSSSSLHPHSHPRSPPPPQNHHHPPLTLTLTLYPQPYPGTQPLPNSPPSPPPHHHHPNSPLSPLPPPPHHLHPHPSP